MNWHEFVFSKKKQTRLLRHILFWVVWGAHFILFDLVFRQLPPNAKVTIAKPGYIILEPHLFIKTLLLVSIYAIACYVFIYLIMPQLIKSRWLKASANILLLCIVLYTSAYYLYWNVFPFIDSLFGPYQVNDYFAHFWPALYLGIINSIKVVAIAAIIKYIKYLWLKQKETEKLEKEKINTELQLLKAQVHPDFLFKTLNNVYVHSLVASPRSSEMLLKLSDLLSYMLYECDKDLVPLEKEIAMMKEYMQLERIKQNDEPETEVTVKGELAGKWIAPFLLLPFIENSFKHSGQMTEQSWINLNIKIEDDRFSMKLTNGVLQTIEQPMVPANGLANVQKRLNLLYAGNHELRITSEQEMFIVFLKIRLVDTLSNNLDEENPVLKKEEILHY